MLIICEGPDKCGKSTFVEESADGEVYEAYDLYNTHLYKTHLTILDYWYEQATSREFYLYQKTLFYVYI